MFDLTGRTALVTGASGAIGGAIATSLHQAGANVVLSGTRLAVLETLAARLGERAGLVACQLADRGAVASLISQAEAPFGAIDIVVNNAGLTRDNLALRLKDEDWDTVMEVDLTAAFRICRAALRGMIRKRWGRIVNITSVVAVTGNPGQANYAAAKAGLIGMTKSLAQEVANRGVTVNCIAPGFIESTMTNALSEARKENLLQMVPVGRLGWPADVAAGALYLASEEAAYVTGQTLHINGGMAMI